MGDTIDLTGCVTHGPWGGSEGKKWVYMPQDSIEEIVLKHGAYINSIKFQTKCSKGEPQSSFIGDNAIGTLSKLTRISIDCPKEYLISISGTICSDVVESICFMTNLNNYGPYGPYGGDVGTAFSYDVKDEVIVGFHGRATSHHVTAIGVFAKPKSAAPRPTSTHEAKIKNELCCGMSGMTVTRDAGPWGVGGGKPRDDGVNSTVKQGDTIDFIGCVTHGPWGGSEGKKWVYMPQDPIKEIVLQHGNAIDSIKFQTDCSNGEPQSSFIGDKVIRSTSKLTTISIDCPKEYLISISGTVASGYEYDAVKSICFMTNLNVYGPYGSDAGTAFSYDVKDEVIVGFHGRADSSYLTAIGVFAKPKSPAPCPTSTHEAKIKNELCCSMSGMTVTRDAGPWGVGGGKPWDDGVNSTVKQVRVHLGELNVIYALQFEYLKSDAKSMLSEIHGGTDGSIIELVHLDANDEYLIGVTGFYGPVEGYNGLEAIVSISFHTNKRIYGPFGEERGKGNVYFTSSSSSGKVVGFHGRTNGFLSAIGVLMEYF